MNNGVEWKFSRSRISLFATRREKWYNSIDSRKSAWCCVKSDSWIWSSSLICHNWAKNSYFPTIYHFSRNPLAMNCPFGITFWCLIISLSLFSAPSTRGTAEHVHLVDFTKIWNSERDVREICTEFRAQRVHFGRNGLDLYRSCFRMNGSDTL